MAKTGSGGLLKRAETYKTQVAFRHSVVKQWKREQIEEFFAFYDQWEAGDLPHLKHFNDVVTVANQEFGTRLPVNAITNFLKVRDEWAAQWA